ncbi:MAG: ornithine cyclodeaminase family protein [Chloroflexota bacterium]|nr:ornithine cyclodeaminase family protein [Chloroflexota bacterium]MDE2886219.1 ornithine cyclodeaminase family protein [Chloroflexota bacterium]
MTLILNNDDIASVLTMEETIGALRQAYEELARTEAVCRPRIDIRIPTSDPSKMYQWGTMEGGSASGYFAIRMKSDVVYEQEYGGTRTQEKYCVRPGLFCGLILLMSVDNGEPLAIINDGYLQHMRVGADSGIGAGYMAREDASVVAMIGSGGMARSHAESFAAVRDIKRIQVYSPTKANREAYTEEIRAKLGIEVVPVGSAEEACRGAHIVAGCTDSVEAVIFGKDVEDGAHMTCVGGHIDGEAMERIDRSLRLGSAPAPVGIPEMRLHDENIAYEANASDGTPASASQTRERKGRGHGVIAEDRVVFLEDLLQGAEGRPGPSAVTYSERGNIQGAQFFSVAGRAYELAKAKGLGHELPTEWFLQDIRD